ncbi:MAG: N-6 DNA methylase [Bacteroides sp.]|nr:N-6 DNA methylase [Bacteroides sp.]
MVRLLVSLVMHGRETEVNTVGKHFQIYDPCCGTGGMLTEGKRYLQSMTDRKDMKVDELKQNEISRVVTRGLNPDVALRASGIDWIGDVPEHWEIRKTSQLFHGIGSGTTPTSGNMKYYSQDGVNWLQTGD